MPPTPLAIGDLQGCHNPLTRLLAKIDTNPETASMPLWFTGDLVNRGPDSAATLRTLIALGKRAACVLGNHDIHLLALAAGIRQPKSDDTLDNVLHAPDADKLIHWLRHRPLAHYDGARLLVHAGLLPQWDIPTVLQLAMEIEAHLQSSSWQIFLADVYACQDDDWTPTLTGAARARAALNALTRIRVCNPAGEIALHYTGSPDQAPTGYTPWFDIPSRHSQSTLIVFGHWAALGLLLRDNLCGLDTGCGWGRQLTAVRLDLDPAKRLCLQVECQDVS